ncbi:MAG: M48 family metallopeptidase [Candidatus Schmidhempelia sp.]|nr:M48 family metallopeptidase [Candidatus Schmidhempelia sp.]
MKFKKVLITTALLMIPILSGCKSLNSDNLVNTSAQALQVATLSDADIRALSDKSCAEMDAKAKIAPADNKYTHRLNTIAKSLGNKINGTKIDYKVYLTNDVNAWAMANGCVRVYSGIMDTMNDNELQGIIGHELGHVALGHSKRAMQVAYSTQLARNAIASTGGIIGSLTQSQLGDIAQQFVQSRFSQKQESAADNFSFDLLVKKGINPVGLATAFEKLGGDHASILSSHPSSKDRANNIYKRIDSMKK